MPLNASAPLAQPRSRSAGTARDLRKQIALIDAARAAISASAGERALDLLRQYQEKYQGGTFAPEAAALKIEALAQLGRAAEARAGAERFRAQYGESPQTDRVLRAAGLAAP
jgi:outer membrane protein assembly factor BamD (BamD/ComL family)